MPRRSVVGKNYRYPKRRLCPAQIEALEKRLQLSLPFTGQATFLGGVTGPVTESLADLSNNGRTDVITAEGSLLSVQLATANGSLGTAQTYTVGNQVEDVIAADLTGNGTMDLVTANKGSNSVSVLFGNGDGTFRSAINFPAGNSPTCVVAADFSNDGHVDILASDTNDQLAFIAGEGNGEFQNAQIIGGGVANVNGYVSITAADITGDGTMAFIGVDGSGQFVVYRQFTGTAGSAGFASPGASLVATANNAPVFVTTADLDGASVPDIITADLGDSRISVVHNNGNGTFAPAVNYPVELSPFSVQVSDVNGDGNPDLIVGEYSASVGVGNAAGRIGVLLGNSNGTFQAEQDLVTPNGVDFAGVGDLNGDGKPDIVAVHGYYHTDINNNPLTFPNIGVFLGQWPTEGATQLAITSQPTGTDAGVGISPQIAVQIETTGGSVVTTDDTEITLTVASGPSTLFFAGGTLTSSITVSAVNGVADFPNVTLDTAGTYTLGVTNDFVPQATSNPFTVLPGPATQVAFTTPPLTTTAGVAISPAIVVGIEDQYGNIVSLNQGVTLSLFNSTTGTLGGTVALTAVNGVATFPDVFIDTAGTYKLNAASGTLTSARTTDFAINPAAESTLVFVQQPTSTTAGFTLSPAIVIEAEDQFGNIETSDSENLTIQIAAGPTGAVVTGTATVAAVNGVATFSHIALNTAGTYTLAATNGTLPISSANTITISPGAVTQVGFVQQPTDTPEGSALSPNVIVGIEDQFGNVVTSDDADITLKGLTLPTGVNFPFMTEPAVNGEATFSDIVFDTPGGYRFKAVTAGFPNMHSAKFYIGGPSQVVYTQQPTQFTTAGFTMSPAFVVDVEDQFNQLITTFDGGVTLKPLTEPTGVTLPQVTVDAVDGVATFTNIMPTVAGGYRFKVVTTGTPNMHSNKFYIVAGTAAQVAFSSSPTSGIVNQPLAPISVDVEDAFGNLVTSDSSDVTLSLDPSSPSGAILTGGGPVAASGGVAVFSDVTLNDIGRYKLDASDGVLTGNTSTRFFVTSS